jgi:hypothetical protein
MVDMDMAGFYAARLDEDEAVARAANVKQEDPEWWCSPVIAAQAMGRHGAVTVRSRRDSAVMARVESVPGDDYPDEITDGTAVAAHIARHDPARVLREVAAKREILAFIFQYEAKIDGEWGCCHSAGAIRLGECPETPPEKIDALRVAVAVYSDHPDYDEEWKP